jgi:hypothetical protein
LFVLSKLQQNCLCCQSFSRTVCAVKASAELFDAVKASAELFDSVKVSAELFDSVKVSAEMFVLSFLYYILLNSSFSSSSL